MVTCHCFGSDDTCSITVDFLCRVKLEEQIGEGAFGRVVKAVAADVGGKIEPQIVAVKMLKGKIHCN